MSKIVTLHDWNLGLIAKSDDPVKTDGVKMTASGIITVESPDGEGDIVKTAGGDLSRHKSNPLVKLDHWLPAGVAEIDGKYSVVRGEGQMSATTTFSQNIPEAVQAYALIEEGVLRGISIGFRAIKSHVREDYEGNDYYPPRVFDMWELIEYSHVWVPAHPDALIDALQKQYDGKPLSNVVIKTLSRHLPPTTDITVPVGGHDVPTDPTPTPEEKNQDPTPIVTKDDDDGLDSDDVPQDDEAVEEGFSGPPGAKFLQAFHLRCMDLIAFAAEEGSEEKQENEAILAALKDSIKPAMNNLCSMVEGLYALCYDKMEPLGGTKSDEDDEDDDTTDDEKRLAAYRKSRDAKIRQTDKHALLTAATLFEAVAKGEKIDAKAAEKNAARLTEVVERMSDEDEDSATAVAFAELKKRFAALVRVVEAGNIN